MASKSGFCQHDAGLLINDKLSPAAKHSFMKAVKEEMIFGTANLPSTPFIKCGSVIPPVAHADKFDLTNENMFPEFHTNVLGLYEKILLALDIKGQFMFPPVIVDPVALAAALQIDPPKLKFPDDYLVYGFGLPLMAMKLGFTLPIDLAAKLPSVIVPQPPSLNLPKLDITVPDFQELFEFSAFPLKLPKVFLGLITSMPQIFAGLLQFDISEICKSVSSSQLFGPVTSTSTSLAATVNVLIRKTVEAIAIAIVGGSVGSASGGVVGAMGQKFGYLEPEEINEQSSDPREISVKSAMDASGVSFSNDEQSGRNSYLSYQYPIELGDGDQDTVDQVKSYARTSNGSAAFIRATFLRAGATSSFFIKKRSGALGIPELQQELMSSKLDGSPKSGDAVIVQETSGEFLSFIVTGEKGEGVNKVFTVVEAGIPDNGNGGNRTAIGDNTYSFNSGFAQNVNDINIKHRIVSMFDVMKITSL